MQDKDFHHPDGRDEAEPDYRFTLANERTFLAWQRTSLGLLASAVAVLHFLPDEGPPTTYVLGGTLGALATGTAVGGLLRWRQLDRAIRHGHALPRGRMPLVLAAVLAVIGMATVTATVLG